MSALTKANLAIASLCIIGCVQACSGERTHRTSRAETTPVSNAIPTSDQSVSSGKDKDSDRSASGSEAKPKPTPGTDSYKPGDFVNSSIIPAEDIDFDTASQVRNLVRRGNSILDLHQLRFYGEKITKKDLKPLSSPLALNTIRKLNMMNLDLTDDDLEVIKDLKLVKLDLYKNPVKNLKYIKGMQKLTWLNLGNTGIDAAGMQTLSSLRHLQYLNLGGTRIADSDLPCLYGLSNLKTLNLFMSKVSPAAAQSLRAKLPKCRVDTEFVPDADGKKRKDAERDFYL
jgi:Leucine-rich repeat (LRR) protein